MLDFGGKLLFKLLNNNPPEEKKLFSKLYKEYYLTNDNLEFNFKKGKNLSLIFKFLILKNFIKNLNIGMIN